MDIRTELRDEVRAWAIPAGRASMVLGFIVLAPLWFLAWACMAFGNWLDGRVRFAARWILDRILAF